MFLFVTILILFLGIVSAGSYEIRSKLYQLTFQFKSGVLFFKEEGTASPEQSQNCVGIMYLQKDLREVKLNKMKGLGLAMERKRQVHNRVW